MAQRHVQPSYFLAVFLKAILTNSQTVLTISLSAYLTFKPSLGLRNSIHTSANRMSQKN